MSDAIATALSGLRAATMRLDGTAGNLANSRSDGVLAPGPGKRAAYQPVDTVQTAVPGGTVATYRPASPASHPAYDPLSPLADGNGLVAEPDVDASAQLVDAVTARQSYAANLKVIATADAMRKSLLDILS